MYMYVYLAKAEIISTVSDRAPIRANRDTATLRPEA
jgi:hypothetical protein